MTISSIGRAKILTRMDSGPSAVAPQTEPLVPATDGDYWVLKRAGMRIPIRVTHHPRARRIILRIDTSSDGAVLTLPRGARVSEALRLVEDRADWLVERIESLPPRTRFQDGARFPILGREHVVRHRPSGSGAPQMSDGELAVGGQAEFLPRRLTDWLKRRARLEIAPRARKMAAGLERPVGQISIRDTRSRWGSCAPNGNLSFCWRLVMAPEWVLEYVVAHEVAHLVVANHSREFWDVVEGLGVSPPEARAWLNQHGGTLHRIGT